MVIWGAISLQFLTVGWPLLFILPWVCALDGPLARLASEVARDAFNGRQWSPARLEDAGFELNITSPELRMRVLPAETSVERWMSALNAQHRWVCGAYHDPKNNWWVVSARNHGDVHLRIQHQVVYAKAVLDEATSPYLYALTSDHRVKRVALSQLSEGHRFDFGQTVQSIQLIASDEHGPHPVAQARAHTISRVNDALSYAVVGSFRQSLGLSPVRINQRLQILAERYAADSCERQAARHVDALGHRPEDRLAEGGLKAQGLGEIVVIASDETAAWNKILVSPSHRWVLQQKEWTDVGLGLAQKNNQVCGVILLTRWPSPY